MKRVLAILFILTALFIVRQIQTSIAADELYLWKLHNEGAQVTAEYQIRITASDSWEADAPYEVNVKLISKNYYPVRIDSAKVVLNSESFSLESLSKEEPAVLTEPADYWEEIFAFDIPSDKLVSGENFTVSAVAVIGISDVPESTYGLNGTWGNYDNPVTVSLYFPSQSTSPSPEPTSTPKPQQTEQLSPIIGVAIIVAVFAAGLGLLIYLIKRK